jgi:hypothetical protein
VPWVQQNTSATFYVGLGPPPDRRDNRTPPSQGLVNVRNADPKQWGGRTSSRPGINRCNHTLMQVLRIGLPIEASVSNQDEA